MSGMTIGRRAAQGYHPIQATFAILARVRRRLAERAADRRAYTQLLSLGDRALQDVGISRAQATFEAERPLWHG